MEGVKCVAETHGCCFPAVYQNGAWWNFETGRELFGVRRWIVYPEGETEKEMIPAEVLLKYAVRDVRTAQAELEGVRQLNRELVSEYENLSREYGALKQKVQKYTSKLQELVGNESKEGPSLHP